MGTSNYSLNVLRSNNSEIYRRRSMDCFTRLYSFLGSLARVPLLLPALILAWSIGSCCWTVVEPRMISAQATLNLATCVTLYWLARKDRVTAYKAITAVLVINLVCAFAQVWAGLSIIPQPGGIPAGPMANKNLLGSLIVGALPIGGLIVGYWVLIPAVIVLWYIGSKAAWLALACMVGYWVVLTVNGWKARIGWLALGSALGSAFLLYAGTQTMSGKERLIIWHNSIYAGSRAPMVMQGYGAGTFAGVYKYYNEPKGVTKARKINPKAWPRRAHNDLVQVYVELGAVGVALYLVFVLSTLRIGGSSLEALAFLGLSVCALVDFPMQLPTGAAVWWMLAGIINKNGEQV